MNEIRLHVITKLIEVICQLTQTSAMSVLTVPTKQTPFPYAATGIAAYTGKTDIVFAEGSSFTLTSGGISAIIDNEDAIVHSIAKDTDLLGDGEQVLGASSFFLLSPKFDSQQHISCKRKLYVPWV
jgi:hypothetical protein